MPINQSQSVRHRVDEAVWRPWSEVFLDSGRYPTMTSMSLGDRMFRKLSLHGLGRKKSQSKVKNRKIPSTNKEVTNGSILKKGATSDVILDADNVTLSKKNGKDRAVHFDGSPDSASEELFHADMDQTSLSHGAPETVRKSPKRSKSAEQQTSTTSSFFQDFDVRRPFLRKKPRMPPIETRKMQPSSLLPAAEPGYASDSPSSYHPSTNGTSPTSQISTAPTSLFSNISPVQSQTSQGTKSSPDKTVTNGLTAITAARDSTPPQEQETSYVPAASTVESANDLGTSPSPSLGSISTAEKAAAAKIYLEAHFNKLFAQDPSDRSVRRRSFERYLTSLPVTDEQRLFARMEYYQAESSHTRQVRVLKTSSLIRHEMKGIDIAGYQVVRVLGKGSFGVVRLVTERSTWTSIRRQNSLHSLAQDDRRPSLSRLSPSEVYAMKVIRKSTMLRNSQEAHLRAERDFLVASAASNSNWVVPLISAFQDNTNLYLVMEYMVGGDFLGLLLREDVLDESVARWYMAEMILCIEEAHRMKWIHRDVKPDNFLIDSKGHLKISDFGLAFDGWWGHDQSYFARLRYSLAEKMGIQIKGDEEDEDDAKASSSTLSGRQSKDKRSTKNTPACDSTAESNDLLAHRNLSLRNQARSIVGTGQYMAPEIILGHPYDGRCDWWSLGVILYECLYGRTPFYRESRQATKECIVRHEETLWFPEGERWSRPGSDYRRWLMPVSSLGMDLICQLLRSKDMRLGSRGYETVEKRGLGAMFARKEKEKGFVVAEAADEIKAHPWFEGVPWGHMHQMVPPFVPRVREGQSVTKYFEDEKSILFEESEGTSVEEGPGSMDGVDEGGEGYWLRKARLQQEKRELGMMGKEDESFERLKRDVGPYWECWKSARVMEMEAAEMNGMVRVAAEMETNAPPRMPSDEAVRAMPGFDGPSPTPVAELTGKQLEGGSPPADAQTALPPMPTRIPATKPSTVSLRPVAPKPKKRAKDKLLRDPALAKQVMEVRKKTAFLGYTFRRMKGPELWFEGGMVGVSYGGQPVWSGGYAGGMDGQGWGGIGMDGAGDRRENRKGGMGMEMWKGWRVWKRVRS
ncbi:hypothetical protein BDZ85DRAFT_277750 [Elsinoe ampelina]|uniref:non-specific serine/threonine protein kinase n=1 Tax=Elsinoe ampelina TaxID=302913 RepID=A0A6A6GQ59_9PEZI|nr:hypothetical protein BDZ85DRAFT_277750 [Elsinoe ampelina]